MSDAATPDGLLAQLDGLSGIGYSDDGLVKAIVDGAGVPDTVQIEPEALRKGARDVGDAVVTAIKSALADVRGQAAALIQADAEVGGLVPADGLLEDVTRDVTRQAQQLVADFEVVQRRLLERLP